MPLGSEGQQTMLSGSVHDSGGGAINHAQVIVHAGQFTSSTKTDSDGHFSFLSLPESPGSVRVTASGFSPAQQNWSTASTRIQLEFTLRPLGASEQIVVSATRTQMKLSQTPGSAVLLTDEDISANPALRVDDMLREIPGFNLFRRATSRVSNPTTQGVSLRGLGASGPSRALVLEDGVPLVDPFGGWVYWDRVPSAELSSIEVFRGGASNLYGSDALGGVVQFLTQTPEAPAMSMDLSYGNENTPDLSAWGGTAVGRWDFGAAADMSRSDGYILVAPSQRGLVDTAANAKHATIDGSLGYRFSDSSRAFLRGTFFEESRQNGTPLQINST